MTKAKTSVETTIVQAHDPSSLPGKLKSIGGSKSVHDRVKAFFAHVEASYSSHESNEL